ncbi:MAG: phosphoribosyl-AMP cyclohydrolase, partial [Gammaproteobacteria bacterium]
MPFLNCKETVNKVIFAKRESVEQVEEGKILAPKFDSDGIIPAVVTETSSGEVLMLGYMNEESLTKTIETKEAHYWSR